MTDSRSDVDVSIIVINWNVPCLLEGCLDSIRRESSRTSLAVETIVVDSASDDTTFRDVVAAYPEVTLIEMEENRGYGAACNIGVSSSQGSAVFLLNPDTVLHDSTLDALWNTLHLASHIGMVAPLLLNADGTVQSMGYRFPGALGVLFDLVPVPARLYESSLNGRVPPGDGVLPIAVDYALGAALLFRRIAFDDSGGFDEAYFMYSEELDIQQRLAIAGWTRMLAPAALVTHLGGQSTGQRPDAMRAALWESRARYFGAWLPERRKPLTRLAASTGLAVDNLRFPEHRNTNRRIRQAFEKHLARSR